MGGVAPAPPIRQHVRGGRDMKPDDIRGRPPPENGRARRSRGGEARRIASKTTPLRRWKGKGFVASGPVPPLKKSGIQQAKTIDPEPDLLRRQARDALPMVRWMYDAEPRAASGIDPEPILEHVDVIHWLAAPLARRL
jgi:hypothetical protein